MLPFYEVDVFSARSFMGNPLGVVLHADGLTDTLMQRIARWLNLSETVFVQEADTQLPLLRIFAPSRELPFAGHPLIGAGRVLASQGIVDTADGQFRVRCGRGAIPITVGGPDSPDATDDLVMATVERPERLETSISPDELSSALGTRPDNLDSPIAFDVGATWLVARIADPDALVGLTPSMAAIEGLSHRAGLTGVTAYAVRQDHDSTDASPDDSPRLHTRSFAPAVGVPEDPICGSGNLCVAGHASETGLADQLHNQWTALQGQSMGRDGRVHIRIEHDEAAGSPAAAFHFGGPAVIRLEGKITPGSK